MLTDLDVVGDLDQVVHFRAATDDRLAEGGAVHGHVRAQLHVVLKDHGSNLGDLSVPSAFLDVAEPVAADDRARMDDHPIADGHPLADRHIGIDHAVLPDDAAFADKHVGIERCAPSDGDPVIKRDERPDRHAFAEDDLSSATDELADADGGALGDEKLLHDLRHGQGGVGHDDLGALKSVDGPGNQQSSGPRGRALRRCGLAGHKGEITGTGLAQPGDAGDDEIGTSHQRSLGKSGDLFEGDDECRHG